MFVEIVSTTGLLAVAWELATSFAVTVKVNVFYSIFQINRFYFFVGIIFVISSLKMHKAISSLQPL